MATVYEILGVEVNIQSITGWIIAGGLGFLGGIISNRLNHFFEEKDEIKKHKREKKRALTDEIQKIVTEAESSDYQHSPRDSEHIEAIRQRVAIYMPNLLKEYELYLREWRAETMGLMRGIQSPQEVEEHLEQLTTKGVYLVRKSMELADK